MWWWTKTLQGIMFWYVRVFFLEWILFYSGLTGQFQVKFHRINEGNLFLFFWWTKNLTNFQHYAPILGDFGGFLWFSDPFLDFYKKKSLSQTFLKNAFIRIILRFCLTSKYLETKLKYQKHIKFYESHKKIQDKNCDQAPTWIL